MFERDTLLPCVVRVRAANTRYIKTFGFSPAELIFGFNPRYSKGADEFEDILRSRAVNESIAELMTTQGMTVEEANYESRLAILDELRDQAVTCRLETGLITAEMTSAARGKVGSDKRIEKDLLLDCDDLRRTINIVISSNHAGKDHTKYTRWPCMGNQHG